MAQAQGSSTVPAKKKGSKSFIITVIIAGVVIVLALAALFIFVINRQQPTSGANTTPVETPEEKDEIGAEEALSRIKTFMGEQDSSARITDLAYNVDPEATEAELPAPCPTFRPTNESWGTNVVSCSGLSMYVSTSGGGLTALKNSVRDYILSLELEENFEATDDGLIAESFANGITVCGLVGRPIGFNGLQAEIVVYCAAESNYYKRIDALDVFVEAYKSKTGKYASLYYSTDNLSYQSSDYEPYQYARFGSDAGLGAAFYRTGPNGDWVYSEAASAGGEISCDDLDLNERRGFAGWLSCSTDGTGSDDSPSGGTTDEPTPEEE
jgi:hypothetical protein